MAMGRAWSIDAVTGRAYLHFVVIPEARSSRRDAAPRLLRIRWFMVGVPVYTFGAAVAQAMGEVVGEAWGGAFLHQLGHAVGTMLQIWLLIAGGWLALRNHVAWAKLWTIAGIGGSLVGLVLYLIVLSWALGPEELIIALSFFLPLLATTVAQNRALRIYTERSWRWAASWFLAILLGAGVSWFAVGGVAGVAAGSVHPVLEKAVAYWWHMIPPSLLGGLVYATWTAFAVPLTPRVSRR